MSYEYILWISLFAYAAHIFEEHTLDWKAWGEKTLGLAGLTWADFYVANATVIVTGVSAAMVGWDMPSFALILPALQLINGIFFHILPTIKLRKISPGVFTSVLLFIPIALWAYYGAYEDEVLNWTNGVLSFVFATLLMTSPFFFMKIKKQVRDS